MHYNFGSSTILDKSLKFRPNSRITAISPGNLYEKCQYESFECYVLLQQQQQQQSRFIFGDIE